MAEGAKVLAALGIAERRTGQLVVVAAHQLVRRQVDVTQHVLDGVVLLNPAPVDAAGVIGIDVHAVGITEQVVHVAENLLVGTDQEHAQQVVVARLHFMHRHGRFDRLLVDILRDLAVGVAGQILQHGATGRLFGQAVDRRDRQQLADGPGIRQRLEHREIAEVLVGQLLAQFVEHWAVRTLQRVQVTIDPAAQRGVALFGKSLLAQTGRAFDIHVGHGRHILAGAEIGFRHGQDVFAGGQFVQLFQCGRQLFDIGQRLDVRHVVVAALDVGHVHHQHRVMGGQRTAGLAHQVRAADALLFAEVLGHRHDGLGVFADGVVDRTGIARVGAVIVDTQTAADVHVIERQAEARQFAEVAQRFAEALAVVGDVRNLRTHVEVQQPHRILQAGSDKTVGHRQQLCGGQAELGLVAAGIGPLAGALRQAHAQADIRHHTELLRFLDHILDLDFLLDHDEDFVAEFLPDQRQAHELAVLVAIAGDLAARMRERQHGHQFGLGARFEADRQRFVGDDRLDHRFLLVDLDRVQQRVACRIFPVLSGLVEAVDDAAGTLLQNVGETDQQRQLQAAGAQFANQFVQIDRVAILAMRAHDDTAVVPHVVEVTSPVPDPVEIPAVIDSPSHETLSFNARRTSAQVMHARLKNPSSVSRLWAE